LSVGTEALNEDIGQDMGLQPGGPSLGEVRKGWVVDRKYEGTKDEKKRKTPKIGLESQNGDVLVYEGWEGETVNTLRK